MLRLIGRRCYGAIATSKVNIHASNVQMRAGLSLADPRLMKGVMCVGPMVRKFGAGMTTHLSEALPMMDLCSADISYFGVGKAVYVDKTEYIKNLLLNQQRFVMISRNRRMGKSLTLNSVKAIYEGNFQYFKGTSIDKEKKQNEDFWNIVSGYSVILLEAPLYASGTTWGRRWTGNVQMCANSCGVSINTSCDSDEQFGNLIQKVAAKSQKKKCIILIDECDRPPLECISFGLTKNQFDEAVQTTRNIYGMVKTLNDKIHKCIAVGITKLWNLDLWSTVNNMIDISEDQDIAGMFGFTLEEIQSHPEIRKHLEAIARRFSLEIEKDKSWEDVLANLVLYYNGYRFSFDSDVKVINPYSFMRYLLEFGKKKQVSDGKGNLLLKDYWFRTGTCSHIIHHLVDFNHKKVKELIKGEVELPTDLINKTYEPLEYAKELYLQLLHTGYLTYDSISPSGDTVKLKFPNQEVKEAFQKRLFEYLLAAKSTKFIKSVKAQRYKDTFNAIKEYFEIKKPGRKEFAFHSFLYYWIKDNVLEDFVQIEYQFSASAVAEGERRDKSDIVWGYVDEKNTTFINIIELKKVAKSGSPEERKYIQQAQRDEILQKSIGKNGKKIIYHSFYMIFDDYNIVDMVVHSCSGNQDPTKVFENSNLK